MSLLKTILEPPGASSTPWATKFPEQVYTWANIITGFRAVSALIVFVIANQRHAVDPHQAEILNFVGLAIYWILDIADGNVARWRKQETRLGAQLDILSDRLLVAFFYFNYMNWHPETLIAVTLFLFQFMLLDHYLSNQFMRWPLLGPNYFYAVDRPIWLWNWSTPAKFINGMLMTILLVVTKSVVLASCISLVLIGVKIWSILRIQRLECPEVGLARGPARVLGESAPDAAPLPAPAE